MITKTVQYKPASGWLVNLDELSDMDSSDTVILVFGAPSFKAEAEVFLDLKRRFPKSIAFGCSTSGEIFSSHMSDDSLSLAIMKFKTTKIRSACVKIENMMQSFEVGSQIINELDKEDLRAVFVLSDGLLVNGSELLRGMNEVGHEKIITGGMAGDGLRFKETWVLKDGIPANGYVAALAFYGDDIRVGHGSMGGWNRFGPERVITKSKGNVVYEVDGRPALQLYKEYLGDRAAGLPATALLFPMQIFSQERSNDKLVRSVLAVDESNQSMTFAGDVPEGSHAQLMLANLNNLVEGASDAARKITDLPGSHSPSLTIAVSCFGRRLVLGERLDEELEAALDQLPADTKMVGFYSYGEFSPAGFTKKCELHNQTMTLTVISEVATG